LLHSVKAVIFLASFTPIFLASVFLRHNDAASVFEVLFDLEENAVFVEYLRPI
jgi:hypothetical protein